VDRRERERSLGEHAPRVASLRERRAADKLEEDLDGSPVKGKPLELRMRNFSLAADRYALSLAGPPAHSRRLREIETEIAAHEEALRGEWEELGHDPEAWRRRAASWRFDAVNELIARHNLFYPVEAKLPMDPRTRDFVLVGGKPYRIEPLDADWILERFPPRRAAA
jgi:hypothetical protein